MEKHAGEDQARVRAGKVLSRRQALKRLAGGAIAGSLVLSGCTSEPPTPVATVTPSPVWTPASQSSFGDTQHEV
jgi:hypothetical protein